MPNTDSHVSEFLQIACICRDYSVEIARGWGVNNHLDSGVPNTVMINYAKYGLVYLNFCNL